MPILENGIWDDELADSTHQSSPKLAAFLKGYLDKTKPVIDFGCGNGFYCSELEKEGFRCIGIDGYPLKNHLNKNFLVHDLTKPFTLHINQPEPPKVERTKDGVRFSGLENIVVAKGNVICLEVLEHVDKKFEQILLETVTKHCSGKLIFSWALTGQPGVGHVNTVEQSYAIEQIEKRGFALNELATLEGRENIDINCDWFTRTLLIFDKV